MEIDYKDDKQLSKEIAVRVMETLDQCLVAVGLEPTDQNRQALLDTDEGRKLITTHLLKGLVKR